MAGKNARPLIRISPRSYETLKSMSKELRKPMSDVAGQAIERYSDDRCWDEVNRQYAAWTPAQRREYHREFREWEELAGDTLPRQDWSDEWRAQQQARTAPRRGVVDGSRSGARSRAGGTKTSGRRVP